MVGACDTVSYVKPELNGSEDTLSSTVPNPVMNSQDSAPQVPVTPASLTALAEQLRDGPLQYLLELQAQMNELTERVSDSPTSRIDDLEQLVRLSVAAMEHFNAFTREFAAVLRELTDGQRQRH